MLGRVFISPAIDLYCHDCTFEAQPERNLFVFENTLMRYTSTHKDRRKVAVSIKQPCEIIALRPTL